MLTIAAPSRYLMLDVVGLHDQIRIQHVAIIGI